MNMTIIQIYFLFFFKKYLIFPFIHILKFKYTYNTITTYYGS